MDKNILELKDVGLIYQSASGETEAVKNFNLSVKKDEFVAIVGPSGCGKTTMLSIMSGILPVTSGKVLLDGNDLASTKTYIGYMFQRDELFEWRTVWQNIMLGLEIKKNITDEQKEYAKKLIEKYGIKDFILKKPRELSGGMRQRVALIRTLVLKPEILLLDEPFSALDFQTRLSVCDDVAGIIKSEHKTAILVTHDISEAISMADRVVVLTKRPATVKKEFKIELTGETPLERREDPKFSSLFNKIWEELDK
ncbi:MAG TPA: spermidine/putrescine ABC transporter ATP-binding protein [Clostridiales bacterium]|nr:spermidine/putrescine ABC transporter ATP-binding protein [Clostridiales bacterium]